MDEKLAFQYRSGIKKTNLFSKSGIVLSMTFEKRVRHCARSERKSMFLYGNHCLTSKKIFSLLPLSQIERNLAITPIQRWAFNWYGFCSGEIMLWSMKKRLNWHIFEKSSERLRDRSIISAQAQFSIFQFSISINSKNYKFCFSFVDKKKITERPIIHFIQLAI